MSSGRWRLGSLLVGSALVVGTAVLVAKNEKLRRKVAKAADKVNRVLRQNVERVAARRRPRPPAGAPTV